MRASDEFGKDRATMKTLCVSILICTSLMVLAPAFGQVAKSPYSITISTDKPTVAAGSNVFIKVKLTNISNEVVDCSTYDLAGGTDRYYQFDVRDENGAPVKKRDLSLYHDGSWRGKCDLEPGKSMESEKLVSWLHDFSKPGKYLIQISRRFSDDPNPQYAKSNTITITVLPPDPPADEQK
jgi:hypothetical protein